MHSFPIGGGNPYLVYLPLGLGWLVAFCLIAGVSASVALAREDRLDAGSSRKAAFALELGLFGGGLQWVLVHSGTWTVFWLLLKVAVWGALAWGYTMWRAGRRLGAPDYVTGDLATAACLVPAICFVIVQFIRPMGLN